MNPHANKTEGRWEHFHHGADIGVRGLGPSKESAFAQAASALAAVMVEPASIRTQEPVHIACAAPDDGVLLVDWLNALVFEMTTHLNHGSRVPQC